MTKVMTVCSERHREFAIRSGAAPDTVLVTGQPRFDVYATDSLARREHATPTLLYLSFDDLAYLPSDAETSGLGTWRPLRDEIEGVVRAAAESGRYRVTAKSHPQQLASDDVLGPAVERASRYADTRQLILEADVVVGFQTTALFEAALAGRGVVYAGWGPVYERVLPLLIPFHTYDALAAHATSVEVLRSLLLGGEPPAPSEGSRLVAEEHLGPVDGRCTERVLDVLRRAAARPAARRPEAGLEGRAAVLDLAAVAPLAALSWGARRAGRTELAERAGRELAMRRQHLAESWVLLRRARP